MVRVFIGSIKTTVMKKRSRTLLYLLSALAIVLVGIYVYWYYFTFNPGTYLFNKAVEDVERRSEYAANPENPYNPEIFAYEASRGELKDSYFGIRLEDMDKDAEGNYMMSDSQRDTLVRNLSGRHMCSLQWISWTHFGSVTMTPDGNGGLICKGGQQSTENDDYLSIDGYMVPESPLHLKFTGKIVTCVEHINKGKPVVREGTYNFLVRGSRSYWRMQEMNNPEDSCADYVDIYFN